MQEDNVVLKYSSGDEEIDQIRRDIILLPRDESNYKYRGSMLRFWENSLQQQGAIMSGRYTAVKVDIEKINSIENKKEQREEISRYSKFT